MCRQTDVSYFVCGGCAPCRRVVDELAAFKRSQKSKGQDLACKPRERSMHSTLRLGMEGDQEGRTKQRFLLSVTAD